MNQIIIAIIILAVLYYLDKYYNPNKKIGDIGESIVANRLALLPRDYMIYNNIHCGFYQIDHLVIRPSSRDIFVIETKKWGGKITGKYDDKRWMQYKDGKVAFYKNPIQQNRKHCYAVRKRYKGYHVHNVVVFVGNNDVPKFRCITNEDNLINYISNKVSNRSQIGMQSDWLSLLRKP